MGYLTDWISYTPQVVFVFVALFLPGYLVLRSMRLDHFTSLAVGPAWSMTMIGISAIGYGRFGIAWTPLTFAVFVAAICVLGFVIGRILPRQWFSFPRFLQSTSTKYRLYLVLTSLIVMGILILPVLMRADPVVPHFEADPMYHYNGVNNIEHTDFASMFGAMKANYGLRIRWITYPAVWHALVSLVATTGNIVAVTHILAYIMIPVVWVVGMMYLARVTFPGRNNLAIVVAVVSLLFPMFPNYLTTSSGFWPNSLALAVLPATLAVVVMCWREYEEKRHFGSFFVAMVVFFGALGGASLTHPSILFTVIWISIPTACWLVIKWNIVLLKSNRPTIVKAIVVTATVVVAVATVAAFQMNRVQAYMNRDFSREFEDVPRRIMSTIMLWASGTNLLLNLAVAGTVLLLVAIGFVTVFKQKTGRWIAFGWSAQTLLILGSYLPLGPLTKISGIWYHDTYRLLSVQVIFSVLLVAVAVYEIKRYLLPRVAQMFGSESRSVLERIDLAFLVAIGLVLTLGSGFLKYSTVYADARPHIGDGEILSSRGELELIESLQSDIPAGSVVIGDPTTGVAYVPSYGPINSVFSQINQRDLDVDGNFMAQRFNRIYRDSRVCEIVDYYDIGYYYEDTSIDYHGHDRREVMPGFYDVDTSEGFDLVASSGDVNVWEITGCGEPREDAQWWSFQDRVYPILEWNPVSTGEDDDSESEMNP